MTKRARWIWLPLVAALAAGLGLPGSAGAQDWKWNLTLYMWLSEIGVDASVNDHEVLDRKVDLDDVLDDLDFSAQAHLEGQRGRHGVLFDAYYSDLGDEDKHFDLSGPAEIVAKGDLELTLLEAAGIFNPRGDGTGFSVIYGARLVDIDEEIDARIVLGPASTVSRRYEASTTLLDGMLGARHVGRLSERWRSYFRADASAGGTELTWNAMLGVGYELGATGRYSAVAGYRYMEIDFKEKDQRAEIESQVKLGGFITGLRIGF